MAQHAKTKTSLSMLFGIINGIFLSLLIGVGGVIAPRHDTPTGVLLGLGFGSIFILAFLVMYYATTRKSVSQQKRIRSCFEIIGITFSLVIGSYLLVSLLIPTNILLHFLLLPVIATSAGILLILLKK